MIARRGFLAATTAAPAILSACGRDHDIAGAFTPGGAERGHLLRADTPRQSPAVTHRADVVIAGAGIAGLAAARALRQRGVEDLVLLDLEDTPGGNSRGGELQGLPCPLGAHYLPVPGEHAREVQELLEELGLRKRVAGRWQISERHQAHAPQERLFFEGVWQEGLLPLQGVGATTLAQYLRFAQEVAAAQATGAFRIPVRDRAALAPWDGESFGTWLRRHGLTDPHLRWFLDYCCRDDYGVGVESVAAWAGLHYFAARHGFHPPGSPETGEREAVLTWPEGNGWLVRRLAEPLGMRVRTGQLVLRVAETRDGVELDVFDLARRHTARWQAKRAILALPAFVAARIVDPAPDALRARASALRHAPWLVVNAHLRRPPRQDHPGMPVAWDNVVYGGHDSLGYVVATHQRVAPVAGPTVWTWYLAPGPAQRGAMLQQPWTHWRDRLVGDLRRAHPDIASLVTHLTVTRHGHAMPIPSPGVMSQLPSAPVGGRIHYAHSDWAGYSIFEEAFTLGDRAGHAAGAALRR